MDIKTDKMFFFVDMVCPVCGTEFISTKTKVKVKDNMPLGYETYLVPIYPNELNNPLSYELDVCPNCNFSAFHKDFKENGTEYINIVKSFFNEIKKLSKNVDFSMKYRNYEEARIAYILAAFIYDNISQKDYVKLGKCYIRVAWYSKELRDIDFYRKSIKMALNCYERAYNETEDFKLGAMFFYLISMIYMELGDFDSAIPYMNKLNSDQKAKKIPEIKTKLEEQTLYLREKIKEINEEMKDKTDDEKKAAKIKRKNAVKVPKFTEPFGIEVKEPNKREGEFNQGNVEKKFKKKLMIIDRSILFAKTIEKILDDYCMVVNISTDGSKAIENFKKYGPDIVTIDTEIPEKDGIVILKEIKKISLECKVIIISGNQNSGIIKEAIKYGAANYLLKPIDKEKLLTIIKNS